MLGPKYAGGIYSEGRAFAVVGDPLARRLIDSARKKNVVDLSVVLADDLPVSWPGRGVGNHRQPYMTIRFGHEPQHPDALRDAHDGQPRRHAPGPARLRPAAGRVRRRDVRARGAGWLAEYEAKYGPRGTSDVTTEKVPLSQTCGPARVIDVRHLLGTTDSEAGRPRRRSPRPTSGRTRKQHGELHPGDIVIFRSGWSDRYCRPLPAGKACLDDPLNGKSEGWPAPGPDAILYLAKKGVRCVATDAPTLGGVEPKRAHDLLGARRQGDGRRRVPDERGPDAGRGLLPVRGGEDPRLPRRPWPGDRAGLIPEKRGHLPGLALRKR